MTTYELHDTVDDRRALPDLMGGLVRLVARIQRHRRRYSTLQSIAHLDAMQLKDIGLDPDDVADALRGDGEVLWTKVPRLR
jgi:uncharacterized protein YjiS (DUF1127 family)